ncbi:cmgc cdk protein kinase [Ophiostoma piceae UAMH 11346]|uniref:Serine/threonine-protein kinase BUR1 n=1 Tax=Ophiostoma piceae (strain UAMH 11346) TaxID=1262450 RepID=S3CCF6_OPHP1|nr:cmgc cdk protein kinase [Ophiostoma piceae UAMH 11346]
MASSIFLNPPSPRSFAHRHMRSQASYQGCSNIRDYELLGKLGEGTFGEVHKAKSRRTGEMVALKKIIMHNEKDGFPITALREIKLLKLLNHKNVLKLEDMAVEHSQKSTDKRKRPIMYMVMPYMDHDLSGLLDNPSVQFDIPQIKCYLLQLLEGLRYLHDNHILHRDMKAANLLINNQGILQIADFGLARQYEGDVPVPGHGGGEGKKEYTSLVVTRWYRPPELLLQLKRYTTAIDVWGVGCVFGEMLVGKPILAGISDSHQLEMIWDICGSPTPENMPSWNSLPGAQGLTPRVRPGDLAMRFKEFGPTAVSLLSQLMKLDWRGRINAVDALQHPYFRTPPLPARPGDIPMFEESHELDRRKFDDRKAALPPAPKGGTVGRGHANGGFGPNGGFEGGGGGRQGHPQDRGPPRGPPGHGPPGGDDGRRPAWARGAHGLPPRPPPPANDAPVHGERYDRDRGDRDRDRDRNRDRDRDRHGPSRGRGGGGGGGGRNADTDTYIPAYMRDGGGGRDSGHDERRRHDDWDDPARYGGRKDRYDNGPRQSRSRSPIRNRDRDRDRDRDVYRR